MAPWHIFDTTWDKVSSHDGLLVGPCYVTALVEALHMQGDDRVVFMLGWSHCRPSHNEAWSLSEYS